MAEFATVARPYAKALYELAQKQNTLRPWLDKLTVMADVVVDSKVSELLANPERAAREKAQLFLELLESEKLDQSLQQFVLVLAENGRLPVLPAILAQYRTLALSEDDTLQATVYSAFPLEEKLLVDLVADLEKRIQSKLQVHVEVDADLIGGIKVEFGDQVLDMSVQGKLNALRAAMIN